MKFLKVILSILFNSNNWLTKSPEPILGSNTFKLLPFKNSFADMLFFPDFFTNLVMDVVGGFLPGNIIGGLTGNTVGNWIVGLAFGWYLVDQSGADLIGTLTGGALAGKTLANILVVKVSGDVMAGVRKRYM